MTDRQADPAMYARVFEHHHEGVLILEDLTRRFGGALFVKGGEEGRRQTWGFASGGTWGILSLDQTTALQLQASATWGTAGGGTSSAQLHELDLVLHP